MTITTAQPTGTAGDHTISGVRANVLGLLAIPGSAVCVLIPFYLLWGGPRLIAGVETVSAPLPLLLGGILSIIVHELLHAFGYVVVGRAPRSSLHFGIDRKTFSPFSGCTAAMPAYAYRVAILLPAVVLGVIPTLIALVSGSGALIMYGLYMLAIAGGDFVALWAMRAVPSAAWVQDHHERVGCRIIGEEEREQHLQALPERETPARQEGSA